MSANTNRERIRACFDGLGDVPGGYIGACRTVGEARAEAERWRTMTPEESATERAHWRAGTTTEDQRRQAAKVHKPVEGKPRPAARIVTLADVKPERVSWLWQGRIPFGMLTVIDGDPGVGKSTLLLDVTARITTGAPMPLETERRAPADVIMIGAEDHLAATVRPRLDAAGGDPRRAHSIVAMPRTNDPDAPPTLDDCREVERIVVERGAVMVTVDPIMAHLPQGTDAYRDADMRSLLTPWAMMAARTRAAVVIVRHLRKGAGSALYRGGGSIGIIGAARSALLVARDPDDPKACVLASSKGNLAATAPSLRYRLIDRDGIGAIEWLGIADVTADELAVVPERADGDEAGDPVDAACEALREVLADGPQPTNDVRRDVAAMTGASSRTIERARARVGVIAHKGTGGGWYLGLPTQGRHYGESGGVDLPTRSNGVGSFDNSERNKTANHKAATLDDGLVRAREEL